MTEYNFEYRGVTCVAVDWDELIFHFKYKNTWWVYPQCGYINKSADTDHIKAVIVNFLLFMQSNKGQKVPDWS